MKIDRALKVDVGRQVKPLTDAYAVITRQIQAKLRSITPDNFTEAGAMQVKEEIDALTMRMTALAVRWLKRSVPQVYREAAGIAARNAQATGYRKRLSVNHKGVISRRQEAALAFLNEAAASTRTFAAQYINAVRDVVKALKNIPAKTEEFNFDKIIVGIIAETLKLKQGVWFAKSKFMQKLLDVVVNASFVYINGRNYDIRYYTDLVARTELAKAFTDGTIATLTEFGADLVEFSKHANPCDTCALYEGNIYSISGRSSKYPKLPDEAEIPVHPNCGHALLPVADWGF